MKVHSLSTSLRQLAALSRTARGKKALLTGGILSFGACTLTTYLSPINNDSTKKVTPEEVANHNKRNDLWIAVNGNVYDFTSFLPNHPGGVKALLNFAGRDGTTTYNQLHQKGLLEKFLPPEAFVGVLDGEFPKDDEGDLSDEEMERMQYIENKPPIHQITNLTDFEYIAKKVLPLHAWAYYSTGADDELTMRENRYFFQKILFRPRILRDVSDIDTSTTMLSSSTSAPFYVSATALCALADPDGEVAIARACGKEDIIQMISTQASRSVEECAAVATPEQTQWFQLYVNEDREVATGMVDEAVKRGMKGIFITVDAPVLGNREKEQRAKPDFDPLEGDGGSATLSSSFISKSLTWADVDFFKKHTKLPIVIKGVQTIEDVLMAVDMNVDGVVLSNHGGRQLDTAPSGIQVLTDVMPILKERCLENKLEIYIDGGVRRGSDILKALCLGAKGVGLGRPFLYALGSYGEEGVSRAIKMLKRELVMDMSLMGVTKIEDLGPEYVDLRYVNSGTKARDMGFSSVYEPAAFPKFDVEDGE